MNRNTYRLVFSKKSGMLVPVAEATTSQGKAGAGEGTVHSGAGAPGAPPSDDALFASMRTQKLAAQVALAFTVWGSTWGSAAWAQALPQGGSLSSGQGSVVVNGNAMVVNQGTAVMGINWQSFSIGANNTVQFVQPDANSVAINQVVGNSRSEIFGGLSANGKVFLLNPNGVLFGATAQVDVGALVASTAKTLTQDSKGQWVLGAPGAGSVINQGHIRAQDGGFVVLAGAQVRNDGSIQANGGGVALAVGETVTLDISQGSQLKVKVDGDVLNALVDNQGVILAEGGAVYLTASGRETLLQTVVNNGGAIQANSVVEREGRVLLIGAGGDTINTGKIDVSGQQAGAEGGAVVLGGNRVAVAGNAVIDASGVAGGGRVIIGGDLLGKATDLASIGLAEQAVVGSNAEIRIGSAQGDGGFVETSGQSLTMMGTVNGQSAGKNGEWLIDPNDVTISTAADVNMSANPFAPTGAGNGVVSNASIETALNSGTNVTVTTDGSGTAQGNITISANITKTGGSDASLTFLANRSISTSGGTVTTPRTIASTCGTLNVNLLAAQGGATNGNITLTNTTINTNGGQLNMSANMSGLGGTAITLTNATLTVGGGNIVAQGQNNGIQLTDSTITTSGAPDLSLTACVTAGTGVVLGGASSITQLGSGNVSITGNSTGTNGAHRGIQIGGTSLLNQSGTGSFNITGVANAGQAVFVDATTSASGIVQTTDATMNIDATSASGAGLQISSNAIVAQSGNGTLNVNASTSSINGNIRGIELAGNSGFIQSGTGVMNITASANAGVGLLAQTTNLAAPTFLQSTTGVMNINGTSNANTGVQLQTNTTLVQSGDGTININATRANPGNSLTITNQAVLNQSGNGTLNINTTRAADGVKLNVAMGGTAAILQSNNGTIFVDAGSMSAGSTNFLNQTGAGNITINSTDNVTLGNVTAGNLTVNAGNNISLAQNVIKRNSTDDATLNLTAGQSISIVGRTVAATVGKFNVNLVGANTNKGGRLDLRNSNLTTNGGDVNITYANLQTAPNQDSAVKINNTTLNVSTGTANITVSGWTTGNANNESNLHRIDGGSNLTAEGTGSINVNGTYLGDEANTSLRTFRFGTMNTRGNVTINVTSSTPGTAINSGNGANSLVFLEGTIDAVDGNLNISSNASGPAAFQAIIVRGTLTTSGGNVTVHGSGSTGRGITNILGQNFAVVHNSSGNITLIGTSNSSEGISLRGVTITQGSNATGSVLTFNGTGSGGGNGVLLQGNITQDSDAAIHMNGSAKTGGGVIFESGSVTQNANGTFAINGTSASGTGTVLAGTNVTQVGTGDFNIAGTSVDGTGLSLSSGLYNQTGAGNISFTGTSTNATGLLTTGGVIRQSGSGNISLAGTSANGSGVLMTGQTQLGTVTSNQTTELNVGGVLPPTTVNTTVTRTVNATFTDLIDVATTTVTDGVESVATPATSVLDNALRLNQSGTGNLNITGTSTNRTGLSIESAFITQGAGSALSMQGTSTVGTGLALGSGAVGNSTANTTTNTTTSDINTLTVSNIASTTTLNSSDASRITNVSVNNTTVTNTNLTDSSEINRSTSTTTTTSDFQAPKMVFNSTATGATINLNGTSGGVAGIVVQGDMSFDVASGSSVELVGTTTGAAAGPGVLVSGRTVSANSSSTVISSSVVSTPNVLTNVTTVSDTTSNLSVPVTVTVTGPGGQVLVNGTSAGAGPGVFIGSETTLNASSVGALVLNGTSSSGQGVQVGGAQLTTSETGSTNVASTGSYRLNTTVAGGSDPIPTSGSTVADSNTTTVLGSTTYNVTLAGNVTINGNTSTGANAVQIGGNPGSSALFVPANTIASRDAGSSSLGTPANGVSSTVQTGTVNATANYAMVTGNATGLLTIVGPVNIVATGNLSSATGTALNVSGDATLTSTDTVQLAGDLTSTGGNVSVTGNNNVTVPGNITAAGTLNITSINGSVNTSGGALNATGNVAIAAANGSATLGNIAAGNLSVSAVGNISVSGNLTVPGVNNFNTSLGNVSLTGTNNVLTGTTNILAPSGDALINANSNLSLGNVTTRNLTALSTGSVSAANLNVTGLVTLVPYSEAVSGTNRLIQQGLDIGGLTRLLRGSVSPPQNSMGQLSTGTQPRYISLVRTLEEHATASEGLVKINALGIKLVD